MLIHQARIAAPGRERRLGLRQTSGSLMIILDRSSEWAMTPFLGDLQKRWAGTRKSSGNLCTIKYTYIYIYQILYYISWIALDNILAYKPGTSTGPYNVHSFFLYLSHKLCTESPFVRHMLPLRSLVEVVPANTYHVRETYCVIMLGSEAL